VFELCDAPIHNSQATACNPWVSLIVHDSQVGAFIESGLGGVSGIQGNHKQRNGPARLEFIQKICTSFNCASMIK
jgi:hypothetical protein